jgi:hypothetical protein
MPHETAFQLKMKTVLENGWYILGEKSKLLKAISSYCGLNIASGREWL